MRKSTKTAVVLVSVLLAFFLASCSTVKGDVAPRTVMVSGTGKVSVQPDMATFVVQVSELRDSTADAQQATNEKIAQVREILSSFSIKDEDIAMENLNLSTDYNWKDNTRFVVGQRCTESLSVKVKNIDSLGPILDKMGKIESITIGSIGFDKQDKSQAYDDARKKAAADADAKASTYAGCFSMNLGLPLSVSEGTVNEAVPYLPVAKMMATNAMASESAVTDTPSGMMDISTTVTVVYELY